MSVLLFGLILFLGSHLFTTQRRARAALIGQLGENGYKGLYSILAAIGLVLTIYGFGLYREAGLIQVWNPPAALKHVALLLMLPVFILLAVPKACWLRDKTKHPMMLAVKMWATAHLLANGDLGGMLLFGAFLAWGVIGRIAAKKREAIEGAPARNHSFGKADAVAVILGLAVYGAFAFWLHPILIGVAVMPGR
jgi:uncharacterized membrane protein